MECRSDCGACCIAPSITSLKKPAGEPCRHLTDNHLCSIFGLPERPQACADFMPELEVCGNNRDEALITLLELEASTKPL